MEISDLEKIQLEESVGKDEVFKSIRFSKEEYYLLKYWKYTNKRFATFIKELIEKDLKEKLGKIPSTNIDIEQLKKELRDELREEIKKEVLEELREELSKVTVAEIKEEKKEEYDMSKDLMDFMK